MILKTPVHRSYCCRRNGDNIQRLVRGDVSTADERFTYACPKVPPRHLVQVSLSCAVSPCHNKLCSL